MVSAIEASDEETSVANLSDARMALRWFSDAWEGWTPREQTTRLNQLVRVIEYDGRAGAVEIRLRPESVRRLLSEIPAEDATT